MKTGATLKRLSLEFWVSIIHLQISEEKLKLHDEYPQLPFSTINVGVQADTTSGIQPKPQEVSFPLDSGIQAVNILTSVDEEAGATDLGGGQGLLADIDQTRPSPEITSTDLGILGDNPLANVIITMVKDMASQTIQSGSSSEVPWPPKVPVVSYMAIPNIHHFLWQAPLNDPLKTATSYLTDLSLIPDSLFQNCQVTSTDLKPMVELSVMLLGFLFNEDKSYAAGLRLKSRSDNVVLIESSIEPRLYQMCNAALLTCRATRGLTDYYTTSFIRSCVVCSFDPSGSWSLGHLNLHPMTGPSFGRCKHIVSINLKHDWIA